MAILETELVLRPHQLSHYNRILGFTKTRNIYYDTSEMGRGKTYISLAIAKEFNLSMIVVCPSKLVCANWIKLGKQYGVNVILSLTYCALRGTAKHHPSNGMLTRVDSPKGSCFYTTQLFKDWVNHGVMLVFDEAHSCKNASAQRDAAHTLIREVVRMNRNEGKGKVALLSGTPGDKPAHVVSLMMLLGIINTPHPKKADIISDLDRYCRNESIPFEQYIIGGMKIKDLYDAIEGLYCEHIKHKVSSSLPEDTTSTVVLDVKNGHYKVTDEQNAILSSHFDEMEKYMVYDDITQTYTIIKNGLGHIIKCLVAVESAKVVIIARLAREVLENDPTSKVVVFFNYTNNITALQVELSEYNPLVMYGKHNHTKRVKTVAKFQEPNLIHRVFITNCSVGGVGIGLDDTHGEFVRYAFGSPGFVTNNCIQAVKRINRGDTKSNSTFRWVYSKLHDIELKVLDLMSKKSAVTKNIVSNSEGILYPCDYENVYEV